MGHGDYEKLTPETIDALWLRLCVRFGRAMCSSSPAAAERSCERRFL